MTERHFQVWCRGLAAFWVAVVLVTTVLAVIEPNNTFEIFRTSWRNLHEGRDLYAASPAHRDFFDYTPTFPLLFAPFAVLPLWLAVLLWNSANAGALYWGLGRVLTARQAFVARVIVLADTSGSLQSTQSNALCAGLMLLAFAELERRQEWRAAIAVAVGAAIKIFPIAAAAFALFRPTRLPRFALWCVVAVAALAVAPLTFLSPTELLAQYRSWLALQPVTASHEYSVMDQLNIWFGVDWPYWPLQLLGTAVVVAPMFRRALRNDGAGQRRLLCLASVLVFCVLFNHKAESPSFVIAVAGAAIWFAISARDAFAWTMLGIVIVGTVLASSDVMPLVLQRRFFEPYRLKTLPILALWILTQVELWRRTSSTALPTRESDRAPPVT